MALPSQGHPPSDGRPSPPHEAAGAPPGGPSRAAGGTAAAASCELELRRQALALLALADPEAKAQGARQLHAQAQAGAALDAHAPLQAPAGLPGRPLRPRLVAPAQLPRRGLGSRQGHAALLHSIAHIEFNAINLALDACWRFAGMPRAYHLDWLRVAAEEAHHFELLCERLAALGFAYGDFDAHDGLWTMAERSADDVLARMALVPRTLEARGLDATPGIQARLAAIGDHASVAVLAVVLRDEVGHVAIGNHWFHTLCAARGLDALEVGERLAAERRAPRPQPPLNLPARRAAGFSAAELQRLLGE